MILGIEVTYMASQTYEFFKLTLLVDKIWLHEQQPTTTTVCHSRLAFESVTLGKKGPILWPEAALLNDDLHALEIPRVLRVVIQKIEFLNVSIRQGCQSHSQSTFDVCPTFMWKIGHVVG